jgi:hypothetical protein
MAGGVKQVFGTAQTVFNYSTDIASGNFSPASTEFDNTSDAAYPYAPLALVMAEFPDWGAAPTDLSTVDLFMVRTETDGSSDDDTATPSGTDPESAEYCGSFVLHNTDELQRVTIVISLTGVTKCLFYVRNSSGQNMNNDGATAFVMKVTPFTYEPIA